MNQFNDSLIYKFHSFIYNVDSTFDAVLNKNANINYTEFLIMLALEEDINYTQDQIALWSNFTKSTVSKTIDKLVTRKLLIRKEHPQDRRQKTIQFTSKGLKELSIAQNLGYKLSLYLFDHLSKTELNDINLLIDKINKVGVNKMIANSKNIK
jgi:DNA-binding MarR family transcriptional regulator